MRPRSALYPTQQQAVEMIVRSGGRLACFMPVGEGKTAATLSSIHDLGRPRTLVLAPARVADTVWAAEAAEWEHTRDMKVLHATGDAEQRKRCVLDMSANVVTLSYENFPWLLGTFKLHGRGFGSAVPSLFDCIVFDELSRMKNVDTVKFRRFRSAVLEIPHRVGLTATPVGNHLLDLWGEMYMIAGEKPLGPSKGEYVGRYFDPGATMNGRVVSWSVKPWAQREIEQRIKPFAFTMKASATSKIELRTHIINVPLPAGVEERADEYVQTLTTALDSGVELYAFSKTTAAMQARQIISGAVYVQEPNELGEPPKERRWERIHGAKIAALEELVGELQGAPLLVFYWFQHEKERILAHFGKRAQVLDSTAQVNAWNRGGVEVMLAHPASAGHGLNLQHGGCHECWFTLPFSLEMKMQASGRLPRPGQKSPVVYSHVLLAGRWDEKVLNALTKKSVVQDQLLEAMLR